MHCEAKTNHTIHRCDFENVDITVALHTSDHFKYVYKHGMLILHFLYVFNNQAKIVSYFFATTPDVILGTTTVKSAAMFVGMISNVEFLLVLYGNDAFGGPSLRCGQPQCFFLMVL